MSVGEEDEDSGAGTSKEAAEAKRSMWTRDDKAVELLRSQGHTDLHAQNSAAYVAMVGKGFQPGKSTFLSILPQEQTVEGHHDFIDTKSCLNPSSPVV